MNFFTFIAGLQAPHDLWTILMNWIEGGVGNLGWALLLLTLMVKIATFPLDIMVKYTNKRQTLIQQKCAPQVAKLQKKFGNDKQRLSVQTQALYKHEGLKMGTSCLVMLVNMILTMVIFFSFYGTLRDVSAYNAITQYEKVVEASNEELYSQIINFSDTDEIVDKETADTWFVGYEELEDYIKSGETDKTTAEYAEKKALFDSYELMLGEATDASLEKAEKVWDEVKTSWLWVQNIWVADATTSPFPSYDNLVEIAKGAGDDYAEYVEKNIKKSDYNKMAGVLNGSGKNHNGFYLLAILAGLVTFLAQWISELHGKVRSKKAARLAKLTKQQQNDMSLKIMKIIMPIIMIMFVLTSSASFGIYILASNIASILVGELTSVVVNALTKKQTAEVIEVLEKEHDRLERKGQLPQE